MKPYRAAKFRKEEAPGEHPYTQDLMLNLHQAIIEENRRQSSRKYKLSDGGETFTLTFEEALYPGKEKTMIPPGTPVTEANLTWALSDLRASMKGCNFGRWNGADRERSMEQIQKIIQECREREGARENG